MKSNQERLNTGPATLYSHSETLSLSVSLSQNPKLGRMLYLSPATSLNHLSCLGTPPLSLFFSLACLIYLFILIYAINYCCIWIFISNFPMLYSVGWEILVQEFLTVLVSNSIYEVVYEYVNSIEQNTQFGCITCKLTIKKSSLDKMRTWVLLILCFY